VVVLTITRGRRRGARPRLINGLPEEDGGGDEQWRVGSKSETSQRGVWRPMVGSHVLPPYDLSHVRPDFLFIYLHKIIIK
jgi:hypothetical protein